MKSLVPDGHSKPIGRYSPGLAVSLGAGDQLIFVSGQVATNDRGQVIAPGDAGAQCEVVLDRMRQVLACAGGGLENLVSVIIYLTDIRRDFPQVSAIRNKVLSDPPPTSTLVEVKNLAEPGCLVEISGIAALRAQDAEDAEDAEEQRDHRAG
jgi:enamine deaminase RidA (YjgF/YER057c/UK114 family)